MIEALIEKLLSLDVLLLVIVLIFLSFTNGLFLLPASQAILIVGGLIISLKNQNFFIIFILLTFANLLGNYILYYISFRWGENVARRILPIRKKSLDKNLLITRYLFNKYGNYIIIIGRNLPVLHSLVSIPCGIAKVNKKIFLIYTTIGLCIWSLIFMLIGISFGENYIYVLKIMNSFGIFILSFILLIMFILFRKYVNGVYLKAQKETH